MKPHRFHFAIAGVVLLAVSSAAQDAPRSNARWQAWYGCWGAVPHDSAGQLSRSRTVCLTPTSSPDVVEIAAMSNGNIEHRDTVDASGRVQRIDANGCAGTQTAQWSADGKRVFLKSVATCEGAVSISTAVLTMTKYDEWLDVRSVTSAGRTQVNVARYRDIGFAPNTPEEIVAAVRSYGPNIDAARLSAGDPISPSAVIEASQFVDAPVLAAWVAQSGLNFVTNDNSLRELQDAGISAQVTDAMVTAQANSRDVYDLWSGGPGWSREAAQSWEQGTGQKVIFTAYDPWGAGVGSMWNYGRRYDRYAMGTNDWSWLYGSSWGFNGLSRAGFTETNVGSMLPPTIVLHNAPSNTSARGRSEKAETVEQPTPTSDGILAKAINAITGKGDSSKQAPSPRAESSKP